MVVGGLGGSQGARAEERVAGEPRGGGRCWALAPKLGGEGQLEEGAVGSVGMLHRGSLLQAAHWPFQGGELSPVSIREVGYDEDACVC